MRADAGQSPQVGLVLPRDGRGNLAHGSGQRPRRHERPDILDRDELLEELLVQSGVEANEDGRRLILRHVIVDFEGDLGGKVIGPSKIGGPLDHCALRRSCQLSRLVYTAS